MVRGRTSRYASHGRVAGKGVVLHGHVTPPQGRAARAYGTVVAAIALGVAVDTGTQCGPRYLHTIPNRGLRECAYHAPLPQPAALAASDRRRYDSAVMPRGGRAHRGRLLAGRPFHFSVHGCALRNG